MNRRPDPLAGFDTAALAELDAALTVQRLAGGDTLFAAGDSPDGLAVITRGQLAVLDDDGEVDGVFGRGDIIGEIGAVSGLPRTRTVVATRDTELRVMSQSRFEELFVAHPAVGREVSRIVANRLITEGSRPSPTRIPSTLAILRTSDSVDTAGLVAALEVLAVDVAVIAAGDLARRTQAERMESFDRTELEHDLTILDGGVVGDDDEWIDACIRQADTVVVVAGAGDVGRPAKAIAALDRRLRELRNIVELIVVNPAGSAPTDVARLRVALHVDRLHQIKTDDRQSTNRAARLIMGRGTALVLSGGGAKGMAHIGVWRAIEELGIEVDAVAGVSFGALMGWGIALDYTADELREVTRERLVDAKGVFDVTLPMVAFLRGGGVAASLSDINGDATFDQLWRPFLCNSSDLRTGAMVTHTTGPVWKGVRASMSIPGVFPPVRDGRRLLVDGAVRDNLPIRSTRATHPGPLDVIAVDVGDHTTIDPGAAPEDGAFSGWRHLGRKAIRRSTKVPSIGQILMRVMDLSGADSGGAAQRWVRPDLDGYGVGDIKKMDELEQLGYDAAMKSLSAD